MEAVNVVTGPVALNLYATEDLIRLAGIKRYEWVYLQRKFRAVLVPAAVVGGCFFWKPEAVELVRSLRATVRPQAKSKRKGRKSRG